MSTVHESFFDFTRTSFARDLSPDQLFCGSPGGARPAEVGRHAEGHGPVTWDVGSSKPEALCAALDPLRSPWLCLPNPLVPSRGLYR